MTNWPCDTYLRTTGDRCHQYDIEGLAEMSSFRLPSPTSAIMPLSYGHTKISVSPPPSLPSAYHATPELTVDVWSPYLKTLSGLSDVTRQYHQPGASRGGVTSPRQRP